MRNFTQIFSKLRNDLQSLTLRRIDLWETLCLLCGTYFPTKKTSLWRRFRKCMRKCSNCAVKPHASFPSAGGAVLGTLSEKSRIFPTAQLQTKLILFLTDRADLKFFGYFFQKKYPVGDIEKIFNHFVFVIFKEKVAYFKFL